MNNRPPDESKPGQNEADPASKPSKPEVISPFIEAFRMLAHITTAICLMLICGGIGYTVDYYLEIKGGVMLGFLGGGTLAIRHLIAVTSKTP
ncbi:MAG: hypothetical protein JKY95_15940 [Planctomycetaceae bacterium]|nr:hypothetical protein [Planctomycetaceae bacterium]